MVKYEQFGARDDGGRIRFEVFVPGPRDYEPDRGGDAHIQSISAYGTFQAQLTGTNWDKNTALALGAAAHDGGVLYTTTTPALEDGFYEYKYIVAFDADDGSRADDRVVNDPCARYAVGERENSGVVVGGSGPGDNPITPLGQRLPPSDLVIYELFIDDFTKEYRAGRAPVDAVVDKLDRIVQLGFNAIEFMPWTSWVGGGFNWGYMPYQYYSVECAYVHDPVDEREQLSRLKALISACHERGVHVIMDAVFNHVVPLALEESGRLPVDRQIRRRRVRHRDGFQQRLHRGIHRRKLPVLDRHVRHRRPAPRLHQGLLPRLGGARAPEGDRRHP
jgi:hypothetical protein